MSIGSRPLVAVLSPFVPWPGIPHAGGQFLFTYLQELATHCDVELLVPDSAENLPYVDLSPVKTHMVQGTYQRKAVTRAAQFAADRYVTLSAGRQTNAAFRRDPHVAATLEQADMVEVQFTQYLPLAQLLLGASRAKPVSVFCHDVWTQSLDRRAVSSSDPLRKMLAKAVRRKVRRMERDALNRTSIIFTFTQKDQDLLRAMGVITKMGIVDPPLFLPRPVPGPCAEPVVLFVAAMSRSENQDAGRWLIRDIWPAVRARIPLARLIVAGEAPMRIIKELDAPGVTFTGQVPDLDPHYRSARVAVAPMLTGAGLKFKVPQAMAYGLPVVTTSVGAEGLCEGEWSHSDPFAAVTDDAGTFADALVSALEAPEVAGPLGLAFVGERFSMKDATRRVGECYSELLSR